MGTWFSERRIRTKRHHHEVFPGCCLVCWPTAGLTLASASRREIVTGCRMVPDSSGNPKEQMPADLLGALSKAILPLLCLSGPCLVGAGRRRAPSHPSWCHREPLRGDPAGAAGSRVTPCLAQPMLAKHVHSAVLCKVPDTSK